MHSTIKSTFNDLQHGWNMYNLGSIYHQTINSQNGFWILLIDVCCFLRFSAHLCCKW